MGLHFWCIRFIFQPIRSKNLTVTTKIENAKHDISKKADIPEVQTPVIPEVKKQGKIDIRMARTGTHQFNTRSKNKRVDHVTTFKNTPSMFKMDTAKLQEVNKEETQMKSAPQSKPFTNAELLRVQIV